MKCEKCSHEQESGKFCGKCGNALTAQVAPKAESSHLHTSHSTEPINSSQTTITAPSYQAPVDPNLHVEKVKETSKQYWGYFLEHLKSPSIIVADAHKNLVNALIAFAIFAIITTLGIYDIISFFIGPVNEFSSMFSQESIKPSFIKVLIYTVLVLAVVFALSIGSLFAVSKFFGPQTQLKPLIAMFGTYLIPISVVLLAAYLLLLIDSRSIGSNLFIIALFFSMFVLPLFLITSLLQQKSQQIDTFYAFVIYNVLFMFGLFIVFTVFMDINLTNLYGGIEELFNPYSF